MVDISAVAGLATSIRAAVEVTKAMKDIRDANLIQTKVFELTREIMAAQSYALEAVSAQSALLARVRELEEEKAKLEAWESEKKRYKLERLPPGVFVYALKPEMSGGEPSHRICTTCYNRGKKSILQELDEGYAKCPECSTEIHWSTGRGSFTSEYDPITED